MKYYGFLGIIHDLDSKEDIVDVTFPDFDIAMAINKSKVRYTDDIRDFLILYLVGLEDMGKEIPKGMSAAEYLKEFGELKKDEAMVFVSFDLDKERKRIIEH